jgi:signal peptidase I
MSDHMNPDEPEEEQEKPSTMRSILSWVGVIAVALACAGLIRAFVIEPFVVPTESMSDTIEVGDRVLGEKVTDASRDPQQGDIVTFTDPRDSDTTLVKRVIAVGGQTVDLRDGVVYVDGEALDEPYTDGQETYPLDTTLEGVTIEYPYTVPEGYIWVMGDNRTHSLDSRYFGPVSVDSVTSHVICIYWPLDRIGAL